MMQRLAAGIACLVLVFAGFKAVRELPWPLWESSTSTASAAQAEQVSGADLATSLAPRLRTPRGHVQRPVLLASAQIDSQAETPGEQSRGSSGGADAKKPTQNEKTPAEAAAEATEKKGKEEKLSDAERIARLRQTIKADEERLEQLRAEATKLEDEFEKAESEFNALDKQLQDAKREHQKLLDAGQNEPATKLAEELESLQKRRDLAKQRFELAIQQRRTHQEKRATLEQKHEKDKESLNKLTEPSAAATQAEPSAEAPSKDSPPATSDVAASDSAPSEPTEPPPAQAKPSLVEQLTGKAAPAAGQPAEKKAPPAAQPDAKKTESEQLKQARSEVAAKKQKEKKAKEVAADIAADMQFYRDEIERESQDLSTSREKVANASKTIETLREEIENKRAAGADAQQFEAQLSEARARLREAQVEVEDSEDRLRELNTRLVQLQTEHIAALEAAEQSRREAVMPKLKVVWYEILQWLGDHALRLALILIGMAVLRKLASIVEGRITKIISRGGGLDRENRAKTLAGAFHHAANIVIVVGGVLLIIAEVIPSAIAPLVGAMAVVGVAVGLGAQNLIRDYFYGFVILLENQYTINDVVKIGDQAGLVERITLRMTVLRDLEGCVHFIPNGQVDSVINMTHGWSRALFDIGVAYKEDVDRVMKVLMELGKGLREEREFAPLILEDPTMLGVDQFGDSAVVIKFFIKTRPLQQWTVKRELLRRIKNRFDELGIEIPFPHRTVYHRHEQSEPPAPGGAEQP